MSLLILTTGKQSFQAEAVTFMTGIYLVQVACIGSETEFSVTAVLYIYFTPVQSVTCV